MEHSDSTTKYMTFRGEKCEVLSAANCPTHGTYPQVLMSPTLGTFGFAGGCPECRRERKEREAYGALAIPPRFQNKTFRNFIVVDNSQRAVFDFMYDYCMHADEVCESGQSLIFLGRPGTGKTHLACATLTEFRHFGHTGLFTSVARMIRTIRDTWGTQESERAAIDRFSSVDLLVIDEVGVQAGSDNERNILFSVLNERYENVKPTILISNETLSSFKDFIGERIFDRFRENGGRAFVFDWPSFRGSKGQA